MRLTDISIKNLLRRKAKAGFVMAGLVVLTTMMSSVRERREEIGIFGAMGFRKRHVMEIIFAEAAFISVPAGLIGYLAGIGASFLALRSL